MDAFTIKPWYQRPRPSAAPIDFDLRLSNTIDQMHDAAALAPCVLAHSLSAEDMLLFHLIATHALPIDAIALDTGRLHTSAHALWKTAETRYRKVIGAVTPSAEGIAALSSMQADTEIYNDRAIRERCCSIRKTEPLRTALAGKRAWVTGMRRAQSAGRANVSHREFDNAFGLEKFNPIADWSDDDIWFFIDRENIPVSSLYDKGYASIGCDPCTRPIRFDEHSRAGRWWWEHDAGKSASECGIHVATAPDSATHATSKHKEIA
jgi:phosphoadenosine phosphosulfate reductase